MIQDNELLNEYQKLNDNINLSYIERLDSIIKFKKKNRNLVSILSPFIIPEDKVLSNEDMARIMFMISWERAKGN